MLVNSVIKIVFKGIRNAKYINYKIVLKVNLTEKIFHVRFSFIWKCKNNFKIFEKMNVLLNNYNLNRKLICIYSVYLLILTIVCLLYILFFIFSCIYETDAVGNCFLSVA